MYFRHFYLIRSTSINNVWDKKEQEWVLSQVQRNLFISWASRWSHASNLLKNIKFKTKRDAGLSQSKGVSDLKKWNLMAVNRFDTVNEFRHRCLNLMIIFIISPSVFWGYFRYSHKVRALPNSILRPHRGTPPSLSPTRWHTKPRSYTTCI